MKVKTFNIRLPEDIHYQLKLKTVKEKKSIQEVIQKMIKDYLESDQDPKEATTQKD